MVEKEKPIDYYLSIIDEIERVRTRNNVNWMDILRLAFKNSSICLEYQPHEYSAFSKNALG